MKFNPGIEGLRGVAILLVVLAHAGVPGMQAGFIGVDIFFVISGFLITGLLLEDLHRDGKIDYWRFYSRRVRRLLPALLVMVAVVAAAVLALAPRSTWEIQFQSAFWSLLWASNIYFSFAGFDYFGAQAADSLLLHTWSLGVEEQFYLVWPVLLAWLWRRNHANWRGLLLVTAAGFAVGLAILWINAGAGYFLMPARLWQLAAGALCWRLAMEPGPEIAGYRSWIGWVGIALIGISLFVIGRGGSYPGWPALLPTLGAGALLISVSSPGGRLPVLGSAPLLLMGRVSYGWYLWHWPVLFFPVVLGVVDSSPRDRTFLVLASFLLALLSYYTLEGPIRRGRGRVRLVVASGLALSLMAATVLHLLPGWLGPGLMQKRLELETRISQEITMPGIYRQPGCDDWYHSATVHPCEYSPSGNEVPTVVFIGDSVGAQWLPAIEKYVEQGRRRLVVLTKSACPMVDEPFFYTRINRRYTECEEWRRAALAHLVQLRPELVLIGSSQYKFSESEWLEGTRRVVREVAASGAAVVILAPTPMLAFHGPQCLTSQGRLEGRRIIADSCVQALEEVDPVGTINLLRRAVTPVEKSGVLYMNDVVCPDQTCSAVVADRVTYRDSQHLNAGFVEDLSPEFTRRLAQMRRQLFSE